MLTKEQLSQKSAEEVMINIGDVYKLHPKDRGELANWCRDNYFIVSVPYGDSPRFIDTYWSGGCETRAWIYEDLAKLGELEFLFNLTSVTEIRKYAWEDYADSDKFYIPVHAGYRTRYFIKKDAKKSWEVRILNAEKKIEEKRSELKSAIWSLENAIRDLGRLQVEQTKP